MNAVATVRVAFNPRADSRAGLAAYQGVRHFFALSIAAGAGGGREVRLDRMAGAGDPPGGLPVAVETLPGAGPIDLRIDVKGRR